MRLQRGAEFPGASGSGRCRVGKFLAHQGHGDAVAALFLGLVKQLVGGAIELAERYLAFEHSTADADGKVTLAAIGNKFDIVDGLTDTFGDGFGMYRIGAGEKDAELFTADTADNVGAAQ